MGKIKISKETCVVVILLSIIISGIIALIMSIVNWTTVYLPPNTKYGVVFDAGSSHTSMFVYTWPADKENDTGIVSQLSMCNVKGNGISSYADNPTSVGDDIMTCLDEATKIIPENQQKETPVLLGATAGMRLLSLQNKSKATRVLEEVTKTIQKYPMDFQGARILTGNEEGSLGWITVNYLLQTFITYSFRGQWIHPDPGVILGALDLGGASTQITFYPTANITDKSTEMSFRLYGFNYEVYTHSYLCFGKDQALKLLLVKVIQMQNSSTITHPCYPTGYTTNISLADLYDSPCVKAPTQDLSGQITVKGSGNPQGCRARLQDIFNFATCGTNDCAFNIYQPAVEGQFYAFSAFFYTLDFLNLTSKQSLGEVNATIHSFCLKDWATLTSSFPKESKGRLVTYCATGLYILTLLVDKYGFDTKTWSSITFAKQAGNADIGWTLGYMLNLTNKIPSEAPVEYIGRTRSLWAAALAFIVLSIVLALVACLIHFSNRNTS
ncbi:ectonucleoside triphosphate diphosphohydrolase 8-like [Ambystoma mexicanum]|uniref:ectonucleoside triphosphate diphosphohydrolase 8-like n=1 Tax=Ambystoma mexicanum TaxID=8296 RepID=UPI0037E7D651